MVVTSKTAKYAGNGLEMAYFFQSAFPTIRACIPDTCISRFKTRNGRKSVRVCAIN